MNTSFPVGSIVSQKLLLAVPFQGSGWDNSGAFFIDADLTTLYSFAAFGNVASSVLNIIDAFNSTTGNWTNVTVGGGVVNSLSEGTSATTASSGLGLNFITGGYNNPLASSTAAGMIRFDASISSALTWRNETDGVPGLARGTMQYVRSGSKGVLLAVGGFLRVQICPLARAHKTLLTTDVSFLPLTLKASLGICHKS